MFNLKFKPSFIYKNNKIEQNISKRNFNTKISNNKDQVEYPYLSIKNNNYVQLTTDTLIKSSIYIKRKGKEYRIFNNDNLPEKEIPYIKYYDSSSLIKFVDERKIYIDTKSKGIYSLIVFYDDDLQKEDKVIIESEDESIVKVSITNYDEPRTVNNKKYSRQIFIETISKGTTYITLSIKSKKYKYNPIKFLVLSDVMDEPVTQFPYIFTISPYATANQVTLYGYFRMSNGETIDGQNQFLEGFLYDAPTYSERLLRAGDIIKVTGWSVESDKKTPSDTIYFHVSKIDENGNAIRSGKVMVNGYNNKSRKVKEFIYLCVRGNYSEPKNK